MAARSRRNRPSKEEIRAQIVAHKWEGMVRIWLMVVDRLAWVLIALFAWLIVHDLAGHITVANIKLLARASFAGDDATCPGWYLILASVMLGLGGIWFGRRERKLRKDTVEKLHQYQKLWEERIDPKRTSSLLTPRGDTRPEDR